ncbi:DNA cytosine methyltransferase, partial [Kitasatospora sp. NPDC058063]|uniref:DNA cytosine methyltransferase n=1 Tax=Kitasatospora sp. NPDC058063 TaxID=3346321 RepID=UPI0036DAFC34
MPILELCAGVGGLGLVVEHITGDQVRYVAETDPGASAVLAEHYPGAPNLGDITEIDWASLIGEVDIIASGFPCQGISNAGLRLGLEDERSGLWYTVLESIRVLRPRVVFLENVSAIVRRGLAEVVAGLAEIGYDARWCCVRASEFGAAHHRDRWFCVAFPENSDGESRGEWWRTASGQASGCSPQTCGGGGGGPGANLRTQPHGATHADEAGLQLPKNHPHRRE